METAIGVWKDGLLDDAAEYFRSIGFPVVEKIDYYEKKGEYTTPNHVEITAQRWAAEEGAVYVPYGGTDPGPFAIYIFNWED